MEVVDTSEDQIMTGNGQNTEIWKPSYSESPESNADRQNEE